MKNQSKVLSRFFVKTVLHLEMLQLAESIQVIKAKRECTDGVQLETPAYFKSQAKQTNKQDQTQYLLSFDKSLNLKDIWVTPQ